MDYFNVKQYLIMFPVPVLIVSVKSGKVLFANRLAEKKGVYAGSTFFRMFEDEADIAAFKNAGDAGEFTAVLRISDKLYKVTLSSCASRYDGMQARLITVNSMEEAYAQNTASVIPMICDIFTSASLKNKAHDFLSVTAGSVGAFCASIYEKRNQRYVLKEEWRARKNVCVPVLCPNFEENVDSETKRLCRLKRAADSAYAMFTKTYGTTGVVLYFFDEQVGEQIKRNIEKYVELFSTLSPDMPRNEAHVTARKGLDSISQGFAIWDPATRELMFENKAYKELFGSRSRRLNEMLGCGISRRSKKSLEETFTDAKGHFYSVTHTPAKIGGQEIVVTVISDITKYREAEAKLEQMAKTDMLTGLLNRRAGTEKLKEMYDDCRERQIPLTVCFADIDGLKSINDNFGHGAGDAMIVSVADVLRRHAERIGTVCRLGGDEFILILPGVTKEQAMALTAQIEKDAKACLAGEAQGVSLSFGFKQAEYFPGESADSLVSIADHDMYREKRRKSAK